MLPDKLIFEQETGVLAGLKRPAERNNPLCGTWPVTVLQQGMCLVVQV